MQDRPYILFPFLFLFTSFHAFYKQLYIYSGFWFFLAITTYLYHNGYKQILVYDRFFIIMVIMYGFYYYITLYKNEHNIVIPLTFIMVLFIYFSDTIKDNKTKFYMIHALSVLGHNLILWKA